MMDEITGNGGTIDVNGIEAMLGVPVVPISAAKNQGVDELVKHAIHIARYQERPGRQDFVMKMNLAEPCTEASMRSAISLRIMQRARESRCGFAASKLIEGDTLILKQLKLDQNEEETLEHIILQMEKERGLTAAQPWRICVFPLLNGSAKKPW